LAFQFYIMLRLSTRSVINPKNRDYICHAKYKRAEDFKLIILF